MYGNGDWDADDHSFLASIHIMDIDRDYHYSSKIDVNNDLDNIYSDQHKVCKDWGFGHSSDEEVGHGPERYTADCFVHNINKKEFYALSWEEIADNVDEDEFLCKLKNAMKDNRISEIENLIKGSKFNVRNTQTAWHQSKLKICTKTWSWFGIGYGHQILSDMLFSTTCTWDIEAWT